MLLRMPAGFLLRVCGFAPILVQDVRVGTEVSRQWKEVAATCAGIGLRFQMLAWTLVCHET